MAERKPRSRPAVGSEADAAAEDTRLSSAQAPSPEPTASDKEGVSAHFAPEEEPSEPEKTTGADDEARLEHDLEEIVAKAEKADEYLDLAQRMRADFENYRKRAAREVAGAEERGIVKLARELLPAVDDLDRAVAAAQAAESAKDDGEVNLVSGIKLVHAGVIAALARVGIEPYSPEGERFDPQHHEAVAQQPVEGAQAGTIVEVYQRGYRLRDGLVLRPARVVVAA
jgi:molecular chaperone GrpE